MVMECYLMMGVAQVVPGVPNPRKRSLDGDFIRSLQQQEHR